MKTQIIRPTHPQYPETARDTPHIAAWCKSEAPTLFVRGGLPPCPAVSVIGSRTADPDACAYAGRIAEALADAGWCTVSGGAEGIDAAAHRGALRAGGATVAVVAGGLDLPPYPREHHGLFRRVVERGGAMVSISPDGTRRQRYQFLHRNHLMVALTFATVVLHARRGGGAVKAAAAAAALGRPVFYVPECPWHEGAAGSLDALRCGGRALWSVDDAVSALAPFAATSPTNLDDAQRALWRAAGHIPLHVDALVEAAQVARERASEALLWLVLDGHLEEGPLGHYRRGARGSAATG